MVDRYSDAVRARRAELRALRPRLTGGHRTELRSALALAKLTVSAELAAAFTGLGREIRAYIDRADRSGREWLSAAVLAAVEELRAWMHRRWIATAGPAVRRIATAATVPVSLTWPLTRGADRFAGQSFRLPPPDPPPGVMRALLIGVADGAGMWRLALLPAAGLPVVGLPAVGGPALLPLAAGLGLGAVIAAGRLRTVAADRARLRRWSAETLALARSGCNGELGRWTIELEREAGADLDDGVARRRAAVDAELVALAPDRVQALHEARTGPSGIAP